jgi:hypothetical protein
MVRQDLSHFRKAELQIFSLSLSLSQLLPLPRLWHRARLVSVWQFMTFPPWLLAKSPGFGFTRP